MMKSTAKYANTKCGPWIFLAIAAIVVMPKGRCVAQEQPGGYDPNDPELMKLEAHRHNNDMSCCAPCAPGTNENSDVFRRPCFVRGLWRSLEKPKRAYEGLTDAVQVKVRQDEVPGQVIEGFRGLLSMLLQPSFLPRRWDQAQLYVPYPVKIVTELRGETRMVVGHEVNRSPEANEPRYDAMLTGWTVGGVEVLPRTSYTNEPPTSALIRLRLHGDERLELRWRSKHPEVLSGSPEWEKWEFFDKVAWRAFLSKVFRVPFGTPDDFIVNGYDTQYEGVGVFHGSITSRAWAAAFRADRSKKPPHWWDEMRLLVTDSDPQYFCVQITLGPQDAVESPNP